MAGLDALWFSSPGLSAEAVGFLVFASGMTSMLTATAGVGGGVLLFAIMAWMMPLAALIPVHGVVQIGSNAGRMLLMSRSVQMVVLLPFLAGSALGGALGAMVVVQLPPTAMQIALGAFILWAAWMKPPTFAVDRRAIALTGLVVTFLTMFFGATAPLIASVLRLLRLDRLSLVATQSACVIAQHGVKVAAFGFLGFAFVSYLPLAIAMIAAGFVGTLIGNHLLHKIADQRFHLMLSCVLTVLALGLLAKGTMALVVSPSISEASGLRSVADDAGHESPSAFSQTATAGTVPHMVDDRGSLTDGRDGSGRDGPTIWKAVDRRLQEDLAATRSTLAHADPRLQKLVENARRDEQRIDALERDFEDMSRQIDELRSRTGKLNTLSP
jgi:uncharacterized membrane protein YfcA